MSTLTLTLPDSETGIITEEQFENLPEPEQKIELSKLVAA